MLGLRKVVGLLSPPGHVARRCFSTKWYRDEHRVPEMATSAVLLFFFTFAMFSFAMTSDLASDFDHKTALGK